MLTTVKSVVVIRPYSRAIRERVFALLRRAGLEMDNAHIIESGTPDCEVLQEVQRYEPNALVMPFHAHRDKNGELVSGLSLLPELDSSWSRLRELPIFMPISVMGMSSATVMLSRDEDSGGISTELRERVLFLAEEDLDTAQLADRVAAHICDRRRQALD